MLIGIAFMVFCYFGCSSEDLTSPNPVVPAATDWYSAPLLGDVVLENMYESESRTLPDKTPVQIVTVIEGTGRVVLNARFRGVRDFGFGFPLYECELFDEAAEAMGGIAKGMSGSPVGPPGRVMGALAYGDSFAKAPTRFWVTAIDAMEASIDHQTFGDRMETAPAAPSAGINAVYAPVKTPLMVTGLQPLRLEQLSQFLKGSRYDFIELFSDVGGAPAAPSTVPTRLAAGDMIGVAVATGDVVNAIGFGTVTQVYDDGTFVAFGHPMNGDGKTSLPVYRAVGNGIVPSYEASYKSAAAYGNPIGTITKDLKPAIVGELDVLPPMIPVKLTYQIENDTAVEKNHKVAYGQESFIPAIAAMTIDAIRQEQSPGTVDVTLSLAFKETKRVYTEHFLIPSPSPFMDVLINTDQVLNKFTGLFSNSAGKATLAAVNINVKERPQIYSASIHDVETTTVFAGTKHTFTVVLLPHWSAQENGRTIKKEVTLDIPENFEGEAQLSVTSNSPFLDSSFFGDPIFLFDQDFDEQQPQPETLDQLIQQMEAAQIDPGVVTITLIPSTVSDFLPPDFLPPDFILPPDFPDEDFEADALPDFELPTPPPEPIDTEIVIDGFVVTGDYDKEIFIHSLPEKK